LGDGWLASAYNTTPEQFVSASALLGDELRRQGRPAEQFPNALVTMWTWITESRVERERVLADVLAPLLRRDVDELRDRVCVGSAEQCAELLSRYAGAGCQRVYLWPLGDEPRQIELAAAEVAPCIDP
jgi:alkanesulfonate monooxygenase SsuD/methylene tetrahydromethanopterin reductase-like flavin-dependent oxidoreductase (luciferase family)